ncbi:TPA: hypothetical protein DEO28_03255 [Candidatus Dependentiae bacterium]|nr:MAG: hypothetical protein UT49_C0007G0015 [Parcubacteria group bacterium GW2011_GWF1_39_37]HBZ73501.1 hypothetical protein [Candidatus Dependentiae bacterium]
MNWTLIGLLAVNLIFSTLADTAAKMWAVHAGYKWFFVALSISVVTFITFALVVREGGLAIGSTIALLLTIITTVCVGFFVFKEAVTLGQWLGIGLGLLSILFILEIFKLKM